MNADALLEYCPAKPGAWRDEPWEGAIPDDDLIEAVDASYDMVVAKLPKRLRPEP